MDKVLQLQKPLLLSSQASIAQQKETCGKDSDQRELKSEKKIFGQLCTEQIIHFRGEIVSNMQPKSII